MADEKKEPKERKQRQPAAERKPGRLINVVPGTLAEARPKGGRAYAVRVPEQLKDRETRSAFAHLLHSSGVAAGVSFGVDGEWALVSIDGHRGVRLQPGQWLVVQDDRAFMRDDSTFRAQFDLLDEPDLLGDPGEIHPEPSPVVTTP